jgi:hypothetical protein
MNEKLDEVRAVRDRNRREIEHLQMKQARRRSITRMRRIGRFEKLDRELTSALNGRRDPDHVLASAYRERHLRRDWRKRKGASVKSSGSDALYGRLPGSFETGKRR